MAWLQLAKMIITTSITDGSLRGNVYKKKIIVLYSAYILLYLNAIKKAFQFRGHYPSKEIFTISMAIRLLEGVGLLDGSIKYHIPDRSRQG